MAIRVGSSPVVSPSSPGAEPEAPKADAPAAPDAFKGVAPQNLHLLLQGKAPPLGVAQLMSDLSKLTQAAEVPTRFASDLVVARADLLEHPALMRDEKAQRLFDFGVPYAQTALELNATPEVLMQLLQQAEAGGFAQLQSGDKNGVEALKELLKAQPDQVLELANAMKFDAPTWPQVPRPITHAPDPEAAPRVEERTTDKRLGRNMLWNVMHLFRDDGKEGRESAEQREALAQLAWVAGLILVFIAIIAVVLSTM